MTWAVIDDHLYWCCFASVLVWCVVCPWLSTLRSVSKSTWSRLRRTPTPTLGPWPLTSPASGICFSFPSRTSASSLMSSTSSEQTTGDLWTPPTGRYALLLSAWRHLQGACAALACIYPEMGQTKFSEYNDVKRSQLILNELDINFDISLSCKL